MVPERRAWKRRTWFVNPLYRHEVGGVVWSLWLLFSSRLVQIASAAQVLLPSEVEPHHEPDICSGLIVRTHRCS